LSGQELALRSSEKKDVQKQELSWSNGFTNMVDTENCNYPSGYGTANGHLYYNSLSPDMEEAFSNSIANDPKLTNQERSAKMDSIYVDHTTKLSSKEVAALQKTYCPTTTPGKIIGDQLTKATGIDMERLGLVDSITKIIGALIERATQSAAEGIFNTVSGQNAKAQQNSITVQDKTAETIMMENYAIKNAKDTLATAQQNLANARADGSTSPETIYLLQQAVGNAQKHIDEVTSVENTIARQIELNAANTEVTNALAAERIAQAQADAASKAYYTALQGTLDGGTYIQPDPANLADLKAQMDNADNELVKAQGVTANARQRLYDAEHPVN
ncbi:MAG: hypothetical protein HY228_01715, partial [Candidatus Yonathbacteria bacterium]|nr:hypothetical protein [Candidatus Yonathbacteria bacterium]